MAVFYRVKQGEHVTRIAYKHGFKDYRTVWDHPKNAPTKQRRQNPNVLLPGDILFIPDRQEKQEARSTAQVHHFHVLEKKILLRLVLKDMDAQPMANLPCSLQVEQKLQQIKTDGAGRIEAQIPADVEQATLIVDGLAISIKIGHLDPVEELSGQQARLNNLGYDAGAAEDPKDMQMRSAVEEFQCDQQLEVTGVCDARTQAKLKEVHGC